VRPLFLLFHLLTRNSHLAKPAIECRDQVLDILESR
jgi:hypothetical protein